MTRCFVIPDRLAGTATNRDRTNRTLGAGGPAYRVLGAVIFRGEVFTRAHLNSMTWLPNS